MLAAVLIVFAVGTLTHVLLTGVRRRRRDLALLKTLGFARSQVLGVVAPAAATVPLTAVLIAIPVTLLVANLIAAWPGWTAARLRPALALRTE